MRTAASAGAPANGGATVPKPTKKAHAPASFSPIAGNKPSLFYVAGAHVQHVNTVSIYSRQGKLLWQAHNFRPNDPNFGWDGTSNGVYLPKDTYIYSIYAIGDSGEEIKLSGFTNLF